MNTANNTQREPSEVELLLPWYAAGTLEPHETRQVEAALASDPELARRYEWVREEFAQEKSIGDAAGEPSPGDLNTLFAKIDASPARRVQPSATIGSRVVEFLAGLSPRTLAWSATAAALAIVLQAGVLAAVILLQSPATYGTASAPAIALGDGSYVLIRFRPEASAADIASFLDTNKLSIVGGPSGGQIFQVRVAAKKLANADLARIVNTLQNDKVVAFVATTN